MRYSKSWLFLIAVIFGCALPATPVLADCKVSPGAVITKANWQQYKDCFSDGVQAFWQGTYFWKMPDDVEIRVTAYLDTAKAFHRGEREIWRPDSFGKTVRRPL